MRIRRIKTIANTTYRGYTINSGRDNTFPVYITTLDQIVDRIEYMLIHHSKVLCCRIDIHQPSWSDLPIRFKMTRIMEIIKRLLESDFRYKNNSIDTHYVWIAESNTEPHEHIHYFIMVNGNACHKAWRIFTIINEVVKSVYDYDYDGLVNFCRSNGNYGILIDKNSVDYEQQINAAVYAGSYLAKTIYDHNRAKGARVSSTSRLPC